MSGRLLPMFSSRSFMVFNSVQFGSVTQLCPTATPWTAPHQASLSITNSRSLLKLMSIELVMPSNHLILCLHSFWSQFSTDLQQHTEHLLIWGVHLSVSCVFAFSYCSWSSQGKFTEVICHSLFQWSTFCQNSPS